MAVSKSSLQKELVTALSAMRLVRLADNIRMKKILAVLNEKDTVIPPNDQAKVLEYQTMVIQEMPVVATAPGNKAFIKLCLKLNDVVPHEPKNRGSSRKK